MSRINSGEFSLKYFDSCFYAKTIGRAVVVSSVEFFSLKSLSLNAIKMESTKI